MDFDRKHNTGTIFHADGQGNIGYKHDAGNFLHTGGCTIIGDDHNASPNTRTSGYGNTGENNRVAALHNGGEHHIGGQPRSRL